MESKHDKFIRLAEARTNKAISSIVSIGKLSDRKNYDYSELEVNKILQALQGAISNVREKYNERRQTKRFKL